MVARSPRPAHRRSRRRRRVLTRAVPIAGLAVAAFAAGAVWATGPGRAERQLVTSYVNAWTHGSYATMYTLLDTESQRRTSEAKFESKLRNNAALATLTGLGVQ